MSNTVTGGRAKLYIDNQLAGIFESVSYNKNLGTEAIHTLGKFGPQEIVINSQEAISLTCSGFRVVDYGATILGKFPKLADLLTYVGVTITVVDRQTGKTMMTAVGCVPNAENGGFNARATSRITVNYVGMLITDESTVNDGESGSTTFP